MLPTLCLSPSGRYGGGDKGRKGSYLVASGFACVWVGGVAANIAYSLRPHASLRAGRQHLQIVRGRPKAHEYRSRPVYFPYVGRAVTERFMSTGLTAGYGNNLWDCT